MMMIKKTNFYFLKWYTKQHSLAYDFVYLVQQSLYHSVQQIQPGPGACLCPSSK